MIQIPLNRPKYLSAHMYLQMVKWANLDVKAVKPARDVEPVLIESGELEKYLAEEKLILHPFRKYFENNKKFIFSKQFRFCPECIKNGMHYIFHELSFLQECPVCGSRLQKECSACGFESDINSAVYDFRRSGFACKHCDSPYTDFQLPEDMFLAYHDTEDIKFDGPLAEDDILIISNDLERERNRENRNLNQLISGYYLTGKRPEPDAVVGKNDRKYLGCKDNIKFLILRYMEKCLGKQLSVNRKDYPGYNAFSTKVKIACINEDSFEADALLKMYIARAAPKGKSGVYTAKRTALIDAEATEQRIKRQLRKTNLDKDMQNELFYTIANIWLRDIHRSITEQLKRKAYNPDKHLSFEWQSIECIIPRYDYLIIETDDAFEITGAVIDI